MVRNSDFRRQSRKLFHLKKTLYVDKAIVLEVTRIITPLSNDEYRNYLKTYERRFREVVYLRGRTK